MPSLADLRDGHELRLLVLGRVVEKDGVKMLRVGYDDDHEPVLIPLKLESGEEVTDYGTVEVSEGPRIPEPMNPVAIVSGRHDHHWDAPCSGRNFVRLRDAWMCTECRGVYAWSEIIAPILVFSGQS